MMTTYAQWQWDEDYDDGHDDSGDDSDEDDDDVHPVGGGLKKVFEIDQYDLILSQIIICKNIAGVQKQNCPGFQGLDSRAWNQNFDLSNQSWSGDTVSTG